MSLLAYLAGHVVSSCHRSDVNDKTPRAHENFKTSDIFTFDKRFTTKTQYFGI